jgi:hypothetical protein
MVSRNAARLGDCIRKGPMFPEQTQILEKTCFTIVYDSARLLGQVSCWNSVFQSTIRTTAGP